MRTLIRIAWQWVSRHLPVRRRTSPVSEEEKRLRSDVERRTQELYRALEIIESRERVLEHGRYPR